MKDPREGKIGVVLAGGGLRGAAHPGFLAPFPEYKVPIHYVGGVSVGSLVGGAVSQVSAPDAFDEMREAVRGAKEIFDFIEKRGASAVFDLSYKNIHIWNSEAFVADDDALFWLVKDLDPVKSFNSSIEFEIAVMNEESQMHEIISNHDPRFKGSSPIYSPEDWRRFIVASARIGPLLKAIKIGGRNYYDGGYALLSRAREFGCDTVFALYPYPKEYFRPDRGNSRFERFIEDHLPIVIKMRERYAAVLRDRERSEVEKIKLYNEMVEEILKRDREIERLRTQLDELKERFSKDEKLVGFLNMVWDKMLTLPRTLAEIGLEKGGHLKSLNLIELWGDPPKSLSLTTFRQGDLTLVYERARRTTEAELDKWLK